MGRRRLVIGGAVAGAVAVGALVAWRLSGPPKLGLDRSRVVIATGESRVDDARATPAQVVTPGATIRTGRGSTCFSVHASRVCVGANAEVKLAELAAGSASLEVKRGTLVLSSTGDELRVTLASGTVTARSSIVAIEADMIGGGAPTVRAVDGSAQVEPTGKAPVTVAAPDAVGMGDGRKRPPAPNLEREEREVAKLAGRWQGSAGGILEVHEGHGRVELDGADVGLAPAAALLDEGRHTLVVREGAREVMRETVELRAGDKLVRGG